MNKFSNIQKKMVDAGVVVLSISAFVLFACGLAQFFMKDKNTTTIVIFMLAGVAAAAWAAGRQYTIDT